MTERFVPNIEPTITRTILIDMPATIDDPQTLAKVLADHFLDQYRHAFRDCKSPEFPAFYTEMSQALTKHMLDVASMATRYADVRLWEYYHAREAFSAESEDHDRVSWELAGERLQQAADAITELLCDQAASDEEEQTEEQTA